VRILVRPQLASNAVTDGVRASASRRLLNHRTMDGRREKPPDQRLCHQGSGGDLTFHFLSAADKAIGHSSPIQRF